MRILSIILILALTSCSVQYSFTGASISDDVKTISIDYFQNRAALANPLTSQKLTEALKDLFQQQTNLSLIAKQGDLQFQGEITGYRTSPVAVQGGDQAAMNRLTISVKVKFKNTKDDTQDFESVFSRYAQYDASKSLESVEESLIEEINDQLTQDIFNKSVSNW